MPGEIRLHRHRSGLLIGVTLVMAGVYRGMVDDGKALLDNSGADLWVVQKDTLGPYAESSSLNDDVYRAILAMPGVSQAANATYLTMQVRKGESDVRTMVVGIAPGALGGYTRMASLSRRWTPDHARSLRGCGRHRHRLQTGRSPCHSPQSLHRRGADTAHGVVQRRPDGIHSAQKMPKRPSSSRTTMPSGKAGVAPKPTRSSIDPVIQVCWMP